jgi:hypothetical protein
VGWAGWLLVTATGCRSSTEREGAKTKRFAREPFRVRSEGGAQSAPAAVSSEPDQVLIADFDGDGRLDTLRLCQQISPNSLLADSVQSRHVRVVISGWSNSGPVQVTVLDEVWAIEGKIAVSLAPGRVPPVFAVGVPDSYECYWYQWDGTSYRVTTSVEPGQE